MVRCSLAYYLVTHTHSDIWILSDLQYQRYSLITQNPSIQFSDHQVWTSKNGCNNVWDLSFIFSMCVGLPVILFIDFFRSAWPDQPFIYFFIKNCCIVARTTWLSVSRKYKRRHVSQAWRSRKRSRETSLKGRWSVVRPTSGVTPTAWDL